MPVGLVAHRVRDPQVSRGALGERDGVVHGGPYQRMRELWPRSVDPDQAGPLGG